MTEYNARGWYSPRLQWLFSPKLTVVCLGLLFVLTLFGTLHQVENGLYDAQQVYFNSWFVLLAGFFPFPGTQLVLAVLMVNLAGYMVNLLFSKTFMPGIFLIHAGLLILLLGGAITRYYAEESYVSLWEGEGTSVSASYHDWEIALWSRDGVARDVIATDTQGLQKGDVLNFEPAGIVVTVDAFFPNARAFQAADGSSPFASSMGISSLEPSPVSKDPVENVPGAMLTVSADGEPGQKVALFGEDTAPAIIASGGREWFVTLRHRRTPLPLYISLIDFRKQMHPGTEIAKSFSSVVEVQADGIERSLTISMNKPLRHRGFTLFQQSYRETPQGAQSSTFAVAKNYGRLLPYISTGIIVFGMILHFTMMMIRRLRPVRRPS